MKYLIVILIFLLFSGTIVFAQGDGPAFMYIPERTAGPVYLPHHSWRCVMHCYQIERGFISDPKSRAAWLASLAAHGVKPAQDGFMVFHEDGTLYLADTPEDHERMRALSPDQVRPYLDQSPQRRTPDYGFTATIHGPPPLSLGIVRP